MQSAKRFEGVRVGPVRRQMSIRQALEWAFSVEHAQLDLDGEAGQVGCDTIWRLMQRGALGCKVDGGGRSAAAADADIIASFVAALPIERGGRSMAVQIAALARAGAEPDWLRDVTPRLVPVAWGPENQHGCYAQTAVWRRDSCVSRGRSVQFDWVYCPCTLSPTAQQVGAARRGWLDWWGALLHLRADLGRAGVLSGVVLTQDMPPLSPWGASR